MLEIKKERLRSTKLVMIMQIYVKDAFGLIAFFATY